MIKNKRYSDELNNYIKENARLFSFNELSFLIEKKFGVKKSSEALRIHCYRNNIEIKDKRQKITDEVKQFIKDNYNKITSKDIQKELLNKFNINWTITTIRAYGRILKVSKPIEEIMYPNEIKEYIKKNALKYNSRELSDKILKKFNRKIYPSLLRKYYRVHNIKHKLPTKAKIGDIEKTNKYEPRIKIGKNKWQLYKRYIYEKETKNKLNPKETIAFLDGDKTNFSDDNLIAIDHGLYRKLKRDGIFIATEDTKELLRTGIELQKIMLRRKKEWENNKKVKN